MKIKLQDYSLISNEWIDEQIEELKKEKQKYLSDWFYVGQLEAKIDLLESVKQQLIPSEKLADICYEEGSGGFDYDHHTSMTQYEKDKQYFLTSEIELL